MQHRPSRLRLNQKPHHAAMLERNLVTSLVLYETLRTTRKRARVTQSLMDRLMTTVKTKSSREAIRAINAVVTHKNASKKLVEVLSKRYASRSSGFTRVKVVGARKGDGAEIVDLELLDLHVPSQATSAPVKAAPKKNTSASAS